MLPQLGGRDRLREFRMGSYEVAGSDGIYMFQLLKAAGARAASRDLRLPTSAALDSTVPKHHSRHQIPVTELDAMSAYKGQHISLPSMQHPAETIPPWLPLPPIQNARNTIRTTH